MKAINIFIIVLLSILFTSCNKLPETKPEINYSSYYDYTYTDMYNMIISYDEDREFESRKETIKVNDNQMLTTTFSLGDDILEKTYHILDENGRSIRQIDSVDEKRISVVYENTYDDNGYLIAKSINGKVFPDYYTNDSTVFTGNVLYTIENGNIVSSTKEVTYYGELNRVEVEEFVFTYTDELNANGIQGFYQPYQGNANSNLIETVTYSKTIDNVVQQSGVYTYSYIFDSSTNNLIQEKSIYESDDLAYNVVNSIVYADVTE